MNNGKKNRNSNPKIFVSFATLQYGLSYAQTEGAPGCAYPPEADIETSFVSKNE